MYVKKKVKPWSQGWLIAARAYPSFCSAHEAARSISTSPGQDASPLQVTRPAILLGFPDKIAGSHLYTWVERGTVRVKCLAQEHNTLSPAT